MVARDLHRRQRWLQLFAGMVPAFRKHGPSKIASRLQHRSPPSPSPATLVAAFRRHGSSFSPAWFQQKSQPVAAPERVVSITGDDWFCSADGLLSGHRHGYSSCALLHHPSHGHRRSPSLSHTTPPLPHPWVREELREHRSRTNSSGKIAVAWLAMASKEWLWLDGIEIRDRKSVV